MFTQIFNLILNFITQFFEMLKRIEIFEKFSLFSLATVCWFCFILGIILSFILGKDK